MTEQELRRSLSIATTNYNKPIDENIMTLWKGLFIQFDAYLFNRACLMVIAENKFFPNAAEIIDAYQRVQHEHERERYDKQKENHRLLIAKQEYCYLCDNTGYCCYTESGYSCSIRCICLHGRDLNIFSEAQINPQYRPELQERYIQREKAKIKRGKNPFYLPTIQEALGDKYAIFDTQKKEQYLSRQAATDKEKVEILKSMGNTGRCCSA